MAMPRTYCPSTPRSAFARSVTPLFVLPLLPLLLGGCATIHDTFFGKHLHQTGEDVVVIPADKRITILPDPTIVAADIFAMGSDKTWGRAVARQTKKGVDITVQVTMARAGTYGVHIHDIGSCAAPDFEPAGGHWNPAHAKHGAKNPKGPHAGDLPNLVAKKGRRSAFSRLIPGARLYGEGGMMTGNGASIIVHAGADDLKTDPSGNSGKRILCGVFVPVN